MKTITITSEHEWNNGRKFIITFDGNKANVSYYENNEKIKVEQLSKYLMILLQMFGTDLTDLHIEGGNLLEVYNVIYDIEIPNTYIFISEQCKYNDECHNEKKHIIHYFKTFYDFIKTFGFKPNKSELAHYEKIGINCEFDDKKFYEYPDGLYIVIDDLLSSNGYHFINVYYER